MKFLADLLEYLLYFAVALIFVFALSGTASAASPVGPGSSWSDIRSTPNLLAGPPQVSFGATPVAVTDVCIAGDRFRVVDRINIGTEVPVAMTPVSYDIDVVELLGNGDHLHARLLFLWHLDMPACL